LKTLRAALPVAASLDAIMAAVHSHQVVVVAGPTGCGKSTQVPQYLLEDAIAKEVGGRCNVVVTQPRRLAAIAMATRVATERGEDRVGSSVGYHVSAHSMFPQCFLFTRVFGTHVGNLYSASSLVLSLSASCGWDWGSRVSASTHTECSLHIP
jgi:ATP-dependent RNA helicase DHX57